MLKVAKMYVNSDSEEGNFCRNFKGGIDNALEYDYFSIRYFFIQIRHPLCLPSLLKAPVVPRTACADSTEGRLQTESRDGREHEQTFYHQWTQGRGQP